MNWKRFARHVNIKDNEIDEIIASKFDRNEDKCYKVFNELKRKHGLVKWKLVEITMQELGLNQKVSEFILYKQRANEPV